MDITVTGTSQLSLPAECVSVSVTLGFTGPQRETVVADTAALLERVRARLVEATADGGGEQPKLSGLRTWTTIPYDDRGRPGRPQHVAEARGTVVLTDLGRVAALLGELADTEGVQIGGLDWRLLDATLDRIQPAALAAAYADAERRAMWIANAADRSEIEVRSVQDNGQSFPVFARGKAMMAMADGAPSLDLDPEDVDVSATLTVTFTA